MGFMTETFPAHDGYTDDALHPFGWSSGLYSFRCRDCRERAVGEKRSQRCRTCAVAALRKAEAYPPSLEEACAPVTRFAVRDTVTGLLFCNRSMHPNRKEWDGLATAQVYLKREAAEATACQAREQWERLKPHHPTLYPDRLEPEVVEVQLTVTA